MDEHADSPQPEPQPAPPIPVADWYADPARADAVARAGAQHNAAAGAREPYTDPFPFTDSDLVRVSVYDAHGVPLYRGPATVAVTDDAADRLVVRFRDLSLRGRGLLPLRPHPDTDLRPDSVPAPDPVAVPDPLPHADAHTHSHRHAHHARDGDWIARSGLVIERYDHTHRHAHDARRIPDDRTYHDDHEHG